MTNALYTGVVQHRRLKPRRHDLRYRIYMLLLDLDDLPSLKVLRRGRFGLMSFRQADHGDRAGEGLAGRIRARLAKAGIDAAGRVQLLCMPRILGYGFNPLSVYFCRDAGGGLSAILYEVRNTFGDRHDYLIATAGAESDGLVRQGADKAFHVSPFMDMDLTYAFTIRPPAEKVGVSILVSDAAGPVLTASFHGKRRPMTDAALLGAWLSHPLLTFTVMAGIHWEAVKLLAKGIRLRPAPNPGTPILPTA